MMRALWTAGSGMTSQQLNVDVISNNLANVNTTGYKKERLEFKDMLYETMDRAYVLDNKGKPVNLQTGHGVIPTATVKNFSTGNFEKTDNPLDLAVDGEGFFKVRGPQGDVVYTRDGSFKVSVTEEGKKLTTSDGYSVLDQDDGEIFIEGETSKLQVSGTGEISYTDDSGAIQTTGQSVGLVKFENRFGLESIGGNFYRSNGATGQPMADGETGVRSVISQGFLEASNVQVVEEMVKLIVAQRAYEVNSKAIQSADEMLGQANNLKR
jgi:flagellar basal-body rod protein FlgG